MEVNDEAFTLAFRELFAILKTWEDDGIQTPLRLELPYNSTFSPTDLLERPRLAASLTNLKGIWWEYAEFDSQLTTVRSINRAAFAEELRKTSQGGMSVAYIDFYNQPPSDQRTAYPSLIPAGLSYDPFSSALRIFSQNLTSFRLGFYANIDSTLFWPQLKTLVVNFNMVSPSGQWYFTGPRYDHPDDDPEDGIVGDPDSPSNWSNYREHGDPATINPLLGAFAMAVQRMPVLEHFMLTSELGPGKGFFQLSYYAPGWDGEWGDEDPEDLRVRRLYYEVGEVWRPDHDTMHGLRQAGREKFGEELIERFLESQYR